MTGLAETSPQSLTRPLPMLQTIPCESLGRAPFAQGLDKPLGTGSEDLSSPRRA